MGTQRIRVPFDLHEAQDRFLYGQERFRGFMGGRGSGKTFVGALDLLMKAGQVPPRLYAHYAPTYPMLRDSSWRTLLALGEKLMCVRQVNLSDMRLTLGSGSEIICRSVDDPERARGPNLAGAWLDEASLMKPEVYPIVIASLREEGGWLTATFTPKGRGHWTYDVFVAGGHESVGLYRSRTADNPFLPPEFERLIRAQYSSWYARQELDGEIIEDAEHALWQRSRIDALRKREAPDLVRVVVAVDPSVTGGATSDEAGIVVAGLGKDGHGYVLDDRSLRGSPHTWGSAAVQAYHAWKADRIVAEVNNGGEMVELTLRTVDPDVPYKSVYASRGKRTRAEPVAALYEQGRVHHVGTFIALEDEMCQWEPGDASPSRMDAMVWAITELMLSGGGRLQVVENPFYG